MIATSVGWKRYVLLSAAFVLIPLPLTLLLRAGAYGFSGAVLATAGWLALLLLYWWPVGAMHLYLPGNPVARWFVAYVCSIPLFFLALWCAYAGVGSRLAPHGVGGWAIYLSNTPWYFLGTWAAWKVSTREGRAWHMLLGTAVGLLILSSVGAAAFALSQDRYRWPQGRPERRRIVNARIVDPDAGRLLEGHHVVIDRGRIVAIVPAAADTSTAPSTDAGGRYLMPGLIDAHNHLQVPIEGGT